MDSCIDHFKRSLQPAVACCSNFKTFCTAVGFTCVLFRRSATVVISFNSVRLENHPSCLRFSCTHTCSKLSSTTIRTYISGQTVLYQCSRIAGKDSSALPTSGPRKQTYVPITAYLIHGAPDSQFQNRTAKCAARLAPVRPTVNHSSRNTVSLLQYVCAWDLENQFASTSWEEAVRHPTGLCRTAEETRGVR